MKHSPILILDGNINKEGSDLTCEDTATGQRFVLHGISRGRNKGKCGIVIDVGEDRITVVMITGTDIITKTTQEHEHLLTIIDELIVTLKGLPSDISWGETQWMEDIEILDFIRIQTCSLQNAKSNAVQGYYRDAYHLIRMVFEGYFVLKLVSTCCKYPLRVKIILSKRN